MSKYTLSIETDELSELHKFSNVYRYESALFEIIYNLPKRFRWGLESNPAIDPVDLLREMLVEIYESTSVNPSDLDT